MAYGRRGGRRMRIRRRRRRPGQRGGRVDKYRTAARVFKPAGMDDKELEFILADIHRGIKERKGFRELQRDPNHIGIFGANTNYKGASGPKRYSAQAMAYRKATRKANAEGFPIRDRMQQGSGVRSAAAKVLRFFLKRK